VRVIGLPRATAVRSAPACSLSRRIPLNRAGGLEGRHWREPVGGHLRSMWSWTSRCGPAAPVCPGQQEQAVSAVEAGGTINQHRTAIDGDPLPAGDPAQAISPENHRRAWVPDRLNRLPSPPAGGITRRSLITVRWWRNGTCACLGIDHARGWFDLGQFSARGQVASGLISDQAGGLCHFGLRRLSDLKDELLPFLSFFWRPGASERA